MPTIHYIWDVASDNVLMETNGSGGTIAEYTHEPHQWGHLISQRRESQSYFHQYDARGSTRTVTDDNQNSVETATYSAFGETAGKTSAVTNPFGFKGAMGYYTDEGTGRLNVRRRVLCVLLGRWLSRDPLPMVNVTGMNLRLPISRGKWALRCNPYTYVSNNPLTYVDASGLLPTAFYMYGIAQGQAEEPKCDCDEDVVPVGTVSLYTKILDVELPENIDPSVNPIKKKSFARKDPLVEIGKRDVRALFEVEQYNVRCCKKGTKLRLLRKKALENTLVRQNTTSVPKPPGPPTRDNMMNVARCSYPVPFIFHSKGEDDDTKCLRLAFPNTNFGPKSITTQTNLEDCGKSQDGSEDTQEEPAE